MPPTADEVGVVAEHLEPAQLGDEFGDRLAERLALAGQQHVDDAERRPRSRWRPAAPAGVLGRGGAAGRRRRRRARLTANTPAPTRATAPTTAAMTVPRWSGRRRGVGSRDGAGSARSSRGHRRRQRRPAPARGGGGRDRGVVVPRFRRCSRCHSSLRPRARQRRTYVTGRLSRPTAPRPYPLRRARRHHRFPRLDRHGARRRRLAVLGHDVVRMVRSVAGPDDISVGSRRGSPRSLRPRSASTPSSTWPGPGIGDKRWTDEYKRDVRESRTRATTLVAEAIAAIDGGPRVLLSGSAIGFYGDRGDEELDETSAPGGGFLADVAGDWEASTAAAEAAGVRVVHLRTGIVLLLRRRCAGQDAAAVQARARRPLRLGPSVV